MIRLQLNLVIFAKSVPGVINGSLPRARAGEDLHALVATVFMNLLDPPSGAIDPIAEDLGAEILGHRAIIGAVRA